MKRIVVCGDDFGMNAGIDGAMIALARMKRLSAVSCLALGPTFARSAPALADLDVDAGVHLNFTDALGQGLYMPLPMLIARAFAGHLEPEAVREHIERQLDAFESVMGEPDYVDGHQHVHQLPQIRDSLVQILARRYPGGGPWLRSALPGALHGLPWRPWLKAGVIGVLGAKRLERLATDHGMRTNRRLLGVYDFRGGAALYAPLLTSWLRNAHDGDVLMCHPATHAEPGDSLGPQRSAEYRVLSESGFADSLERFGLTVGRLRTIPADEAIPAA